MKGDGRGTYMWSTNTRAPEAMDSQRRKSPINDDDDDDDDDTVMRMRMRMMMMKMMMIR